MNSLMIRRVFGVFMLSGALSIGSAQSVPGLSGNWIAEDGRSVSIDFQPPRFLVTYNWNEVLLHDEQDTLEFTLNGPAFSREFVSPIPNRSPSTTEYEARLEGGAVIVTMRHSGESGEHSSIDIYHMAGQDKLDVVMVRGVLGHVENEMVSGTLTFSRE